MFDRAPYTAPDGLNDVLLASKTTRQIYILEGTHIFSPRLLNTVRVGFNRESVENNQTLSAINPAAGDSSLASVPGRAAAQVRVSGLTNFTGGLGGAATYFYHWNDYQVYDDAFLTSGKHSLKFGGAIERMQLNFMALSNPSGVWNFGSLRNFLTNVPSRFNSGFANTLSPRGLRQSLFAVYLQDDWRWRPNLTLNWGLRYEAVTVPTEVQGKLSNLVNVTDATPHVGSPWFSNPTLRNFEPRVGFAWDPFRDGKTSVRGGFGIFDVLPLPYQFTLVSSLAAPHFLFGAISGGSLPAGSFFTGAYPRLGASSLRATYIEQDPKRNYVMQWNFNVQRELASSLTAMVGYVGSRGVHQLLRTDDADLVIPTSTPQGYLWPSPVGSGKTINPNWGSIRGLFYEGNSFYDALELQLTKKLGHGLQLQGAYTWGKSIDTGSSSIAGEQWANSIASPLWFDLRTNRGLSDFNVGRTLVINGTWMLPSPGSLPAAGWIFRGWQLGGIFKASDGIPFTASYGSNGDPLGMNSSDTHDFPNRVGGSGCESLVNAGNATNYIKTECFALPTPANLRGNAGRNILIGPGLAVFDFSVVKNTRLPKISESSSVQFRAEFFNLFNRANFSPPAAPTNTDIFDASGARNGAAGLVTSTATTARDIQFALKVIW